MVRAKRILLHRGQRETKQTDAFSVAYPSVRLKRVRLNGSLRYLLTVLALWRHGHATSAESEKVGHTITGNVKRRRSVLAVCSVLVISGSLVSNSNFQEAHSTWLNAINACQFLSVYAG